MAFIDLVTLRLQAGHGGAGAVAFRREKFVAYGGPYGGDGGAGGDITFVADRNIGTLIDLRYRKDVRAEDGQSGGTKRMTGRSGRGERIRVPVGTLIRDAQTLELIADMEHDGQELVLCRGGIGGLGNARFKTSTNQTPRHAQEGKPGEFREVTLELKLLADVGIIGYPSVGKSTLISVISNARPKIADYPFTTLTPNLGIVQWKPDQTLVVADIPGLIEGAHEGHGLGLQFLRHVERCRILVHVVECVELIEGMDDPGDRDPIRDFERINRELAAFSEALAARPQIVALSKMDQPATRERAAELEAHFRGLGLPFVTFSAMTRDGLGELLDAMGTLAAQTPPPDTAHFTVPAPATPAVESDDDARDRPSSSDEEAMRRLLEDDDLIIVSDD